ncbi:MAG: prolipoprotein diacylglyceryl transferase [Ruminococcus sp.]
MYPILNIGPFTIGMYGVCCTLGIALACLAALSNGKRSKINSYNLIICFAAILIGGFLGAKLLYLIVDFRSICEMFRNSGVNMETISSIVQGGFVFYGGFIGGLLGILIFSHILKVSPIHFISVIAPGVPLAHAFGRVGCFMAGCCYGIPSEKYGIAFTQSIGAPNGIKLFPVQLLEASLLLVLALIMQTYYIKSKHRHCNMYIYLFIYPIIRIFTERFRYDDAERGIYFGLSTSTWISIGIIAAGVILLIIDIKKGMHEPVTPEILTRNAFEDEQEETE